VLSDRDAVVAPVQVFGRDDRARAMNHSGGLGGPLSSARVSHAGGVRRRRGIAVREALGPFTGDLPGARRCGEEVSVDCPVRRASDRVVVELAVMIFPRLVAQPRGRFVQAVLTYPRLVTQTRRKFVSTAPVACGAVDTPAVAAVEDAAAAPAQDSHAHASCPILHCWRIAC